MVEAARLERRRASLEQLELSRVQALREAEIESREDIERARIASERQLDEIRIDHETIRRRLEVEREKAVETYLEDGKGVSRSIVNPLEEFAARAEAEAADAPLPPFLRETVTTARVNRGREFGANPGGCIDGGEGCGGSASAGRGRRKSAPRLKRKRRNC
jgi:hypothetical protein